MAMMSGLTMVKEINKLIDSYIVTQKSLFASQMSNNKQELKKPVVFMYTDNW